VVEGLEEATCAFLGMFRAEDFGRLIVQVGDDPTRTEECISSTARTDSAGTGSNFLAAGDLLPALRIEPEDTATVVLLASKKAG
jgi:hypothetical protein